MRNSRSLVVLLTLCIAVSAFAAPAAQAKKKKKKAPPPRTVEATYDAPSIGVGGAGGACGLCPTFPTTAEELFVTFEVTDGTGTTVFARATQDLDGDGTADQGTSFCGSTGDTPITITGGYEVNLYIYPVGVSPPCPGVGTSGTVTATFSTVPPTS